MMLSVRMASRTDLVTIGLQTEVFLHINEVGGTTIVAWFLHAFLRSILISPFLGIDDSQNAARSGAIGSM